MSGHHLAVLYSQAPSPIAMRKSVALERRMQGDRGLPLAAGDVACSAKHLAWVRLGDS